MSTRFQGLAASLAVILEYEAPCLPTSWSVKRSFISFLDMPHNNRRLSFSVASHLSSFWSFQIQLGT